MSSDASDGKSLWTAAFMLDTVINWIIFLVYYILVVIITLVAKDQLGASMSEAGLATGIFIIGTLFARMWAGHCVEPFGYKRTLYLGLFIYLFTSIAYLWLPNLWTLYAVRFLNGAGYGIASTATSTIVATIIPASQRGRGINYYGLSTSLAAAIGPFIGMLLMTLTSFTFIVWFCIGLVVFCLLGTVFLRFKQPVAKLMKEVEDEELAEVKTEKKFKISDYLEPAVSSICIVGFFVAFAYSGVLAFLADYSRQLNLVTAATFFFVVYAGIITLTRPLLGILFDRRGENPVLYPCFICLAIGLYLIAIAHVSWILLVSAIFVGLGYGTYMSNGQAVCIKLVPVERVGVATSTYFIALDLGLGVGPYVLGFLRPAFSFSDIFAITAVIALVCFFMYHFMYGRTTGRRNGAEARRLTKQQHMTTVANQH